MIKGIFVIVYFHHQLKISQNPNTLSLAIQSIAAWRNKKRRWLLCENSAYAVFKESNPFDVTLGCYPLRRSAIQNIYSLKAMRGFWVQFERIFKYHLKSKSFTAFIPSPIREVQQMWWCTSNEFLVACASNTQSNMHFDLFVVPPWCLGH